MIKRLNKYTFNHPSLGLEVIIFAPSEAEARKEFEQVYDFEPK